MSDNVFDEPFDAANPGVAPVWAGRMEPSISFEVDAGGDSYDRRHLVTTVSYDDLLSRGRRAEFFETDTTGADVFVDDDIIARMRLANETDRVLELRLSWSS